MLDMPDWRVDVARSRCQERARERELWWKKFGCFCVGSTFRLGCNVGLAAVPVQWRQGMSRFEALSPEIKTFSKDEAWSYDQPKVQVWPLIRMTHKAVLLRYDQARSLENVLISGLCTRDLAVQYSTVLYSTILYSTVQYYTVQYCSVQYSTVQYSTALHCTALHCTALHCTALHCTALHCTALHCTALHCTALGPGCTFQVVSDCLGRLYCGQLVECVLAW